MNVLRIILIFLWAVGVLRYWFVGALLVRRTLVAVLRLDVPIFSDQTIERWMTGRDKRTKAQKRNVRLLRLPAFVGGFVVALFWPILWLVGCARFWIRFVRMFKDESRLRTL